MCKKAFLLILLLLLVSSCVFKPQGLIFDEMVFLQIRDDGNIYHVTAKARSGNVEQVYMLMKLDSIEYYTPDSGRVVIKPKNKQ